METLKVFIGGSRYVKNVTELKKIISEDLTTIHQENEGVNLVLVYGGAVGVDTIAAELAYELGYELEEYIPDWEGQGSTAGHFRNEIMVKEADICYFYWDGKSQGTFNAIELARIYNKEYFITIVQ